MSNPGPHNNNNNSNDLNHLQSQALPPLYGYQRQLPPQPAMMLPRHAQNLCRPPQGPPQGHLQGHPQSPPHHYGYGQPQMQPSPYQPHQYSYDMQQHHHHHQQQQQQQHPPSSIPATSRTDPGKDKDADCSDLPGPPPVCNEWRGHVYRLEFGQQPVRARMCGFGDKDRRPISPPPCIRLAILDKVTGEEIPPSRIDISFFVMTVDLWDKTGLIEKNLVRHTQNSPTISNTTTISCPPTVDFNSLPSHSRPQPVDPANFPPTHQAMTNGQSSSMYNYQSDSTLSNSQSHMYGSTYSDTRSSTQSYSPQQNGGTVPETNGNRIPPISSIYPSGSTSSAYGQRPRGYQNDEVYTPQTTGMFTRNLIGNLSTSAILLKDNHGKDGIWFIFQDLSIRTDDWFRLKASFVNLGSPTNQTIQGAGPQPSQALTKGTAPVLATAFSKPFQVFSAKKFPGVVEATALSKKFAAQGVKVTGRGEDEEKKAKARAKAKAG